MGNALRSKLTRDEMTSAKILVVDDSTTSIQTISESLRGLADIYFATSGEQAIQIAMISPPDIIILDIFMPGIDGFSVCRKIKSSPELRHIKVVFVTSKAKEKTEHKALELGGIDFIKKPIASSTLRARIKNHLNELQIINREKLKADSYSKMLNVIPVFVSMWGSDFKLKYHNDENGFWIPHTPKSAHSTHLSGLLDPDNFYSVVNYFDGINEEEVRTFTNKVTSFEGIVYTVEITVSCIYTKQEKYCLLVIHDKTKEENNKADLSNKNEAYKSIIEQVTDGVITTDAEGKITYLNKRAEMLTGLTLKECEGRFAEAAMKLETSQGKRLLMNPINIAISQKRSVKLPFDITMKSKNGKCYAIDESASPIRDIDGNITGAVMVFQDRSASHAATEKLNRLSKYDPLTSLANRDLFMEKAKIAIERSKHHKKLAAMVVIGIDNFKSVNEVYGHDIGDGVLTDIADFLKTFLAPNDLLCRMNGDEFVILNPSLVNPEKIIESSRVILQSFSKKWEMQERKFSLTLSIGVSLFPNDAHNERTLYQFASAAMAEAKRGGGNKYCLYSSKIEEGRKVRLHNETELRDALENNEIKVHFQPKVDGKTKNIVGAEALVRWQKPDGEMVYPNQFIPIAESSKLIIPIGRFVLIEACKQAILWSKKIKNFTIAVNISPVQFSPDLINDVRHALDVSGLHASQLELEITESLLLADAFSYDTILQLKQLGVLISLDDFGTGYSSLSYIKRFPIDVLKIDQTFVMNMLEDSVDQSIVQTVILLAEGLNFSLVAEGVETQKHAELLVDMGCNILQGYYFSKPQTAENISKQICSH